MTDKTKLTKTQLEGVEFILRAFEEYRNAYLADVPGMGKTITGIEVARRVAPEGRILYVCPASVKPQTERVIRREAPELDWHVVTYSQLQDLRLAKAYRSMQFWLCIFDEAHYIKALYPGQNIYRGVSERDVEHAIELQSRKKRIPYVARTLGALLAGQTAGYRLFMSGTPITRDPRDLFLFLRLSGHWIASLSHSPGSSYYAFQDRYMRKITTHFGTSWSGLKKGAAEKLREELSDILLQRRHEDEEDESLRVPEPERIVNRIPLPETLVIADRHVTAKLADAIGAGIADNPKRLAEAIGIVPGFASLSKFREAQSHAKVEPAVDYVSQKGFSKFILFCYHKSVVPLYVRSLRERMPGLHVVGITGAMSLKKRAEAVAYCNELDSAVIVATLGSIGTGFDCNKFPVAVFAELDWSPAVMEQSEGRVLRKGSGIRSQLHYIIFKKGVEQRIWSVLQDKRKSIGEVIGGRS